MTSSIWSRYAAARRKLDKIDNGRAQDRMGNPEPADMIRRHHLVPHARTSFFLRSFFSGTGDDKQIGVQFAGAQNDIQILGIGRQ